MKINIPGISSIPLEERKKDIIDVINREDCETFSVFIHNFDDDTKEILEMLKKDWYKKYFKTAFLVLTDEFTLKGVENLKAEI